MNIQRYLTYFVNNCLKAKKIRVKMNDNSEKNLQTVINNINSCSVEGSKLVITPLNEQSGGGADLVDLTATQNNTTYTHPGHDGYDEVTVAVPVKSNLTATPTASQQTFTASQETGNPVGYAEVVVNATPLKDRKVITPTSSQQTFNASDEQGSPLGYAQVVVEAASGGQPDLVNLTATQNNTTYTHPGHDGYDEVTVAVPVPVLNSKTHTITANTTGQPLVLDPQDDHLDGYSRVELTVNVPTGGSILGQKSITIGASENHQTLILDPTQQATPLDGYSQVEIAVDVPSSALPRLIAPMYFKPGQACRGDDMPDLYLHIDSSSSLSISFQGMSALPVGKTLDLARFDCFQNPNFLTTRLAFESVVLNGDLSARGIDFPNDCSNMFQSATINGNIDFTGSDFSNSNLESMFVYASCDSANSRKLSDITNGIIGNFGNSVKTMFTRSNIVNRIDGCNKIKASSYENMFTMASTLAEIDLSDLDVTTTRSMLNMFRQAIVTCGTVDGLEGRTYPELTDARSMFYGMNTNNQRITIDMSNSIFEKFIDFNQIARGTYAYLDLSGCSMLKGAILTMLQGAGTSQQLTIDLSNTTFGSRESQPTRDMEMHTTFSNNTIAILDNFSVLIPENSSRRISMWSTFDNYPGSTLDLSTVHVDKIRYFREIFANTPNLTSVDLSGFDVQYSTVFYHLFYRLGYNAPAGTTVKVWIPSTFDCSSCTNANDKPFNYDPGRQIDVYTDGTQADMSSLGTIHSNFVMHYESTKADFEAA